MPVILARIDDRLIHGQVTEGWVKNLKPDVILVVSDKLATCEWEYELCLAALPSYIRGRIVGLEEAPAIINDLQSKGSAAYVLFESPRDAFRTISAGAHIPKLNVGGMHSFKGKRELVDYIFVDDDDSAYLKKLKDIGIELDFRDLPGRENVDVLSML